MSLIILLNGTSSAGKTATLNKLTALHPEDVVYKADTWFPPAVIKKAEELGWQENSGIDPWFYLVNYVNTKTDKPHFNTEVRAYLFKEAHAAYYDAKQMLDQGKNIIVDTVFEYEPEYERFISFFKDHTMCKVLVYCPLDILVERVSKRNSSGIPEEQRSAFQSFEQFPAIYKVQEHAHEQLVDTVTSSSIKNALDEAIQWLIDHKIPEAYLARLEEFKTDFIKVFKLDIQERIPLVTRHPYDIILHSDTASPEELAHTIAQKIDAQNKNIEIKKLSAECWQHYRDIRLKAVDTDPKAFAETRETVVSRSEEEWKLFIQNMWFALVGDTIVGMVGLLRDSSDKEIAHIVSFWVDPAYRGKKIGTQLIKHLMEVAKQEGIKTLSLSVTETQEAAIALYTSLGFKTIDRLKNAACYEGICYDQLIMVWEQLR